RADPAPPDPGAPGDGPPARRDRPGPRPDAGPDGARLDPPPPDDHQRPHRRLAGRADRAERRRGPQSGVLGGRAGGDRSTDAPWVTILIARRRASKSLDDWSAL